jgi:site-specific recombinase XerD
VAKVVNGLPESAPSQVPALFAPDAETAKQFLEFFAADCRSAATRKVYLRNVRQFAAWCISRGFTDLADVAPPHVAEYVRLLEARLAKHSVRQHVVAIRMLFDWLVARRLLVSNPVGPARRGRKR